MMWCRWVQKRLIIPENETTWPAWVRRHVARCPDCAGFRDNTIRLRAAFTVTEDQTTDEAAVRRIMAAIREWEAEQSALDSVPSVWPTWALRLAVIGAFAVLLAMSYLEVPQIAPTRAPVADVRSTGFPMRDPGVPGFQPPTLPSGPYRFVLRTSTPLNAAAAPESTWANGSNIGRSVEFGGVPVMPVSFDY